MDIVKKTAALAATIALLVPAAAIAGDHGPDANGKGKANAPGQVCKSLKVKGKKTAEQRAAYKQCIKDANAKRKADHAASKPSDDDDETTTAPAPAPVD